MDCEDTTVTKILTTSLENVLPTFCENMFHCDMETLTTTHKSLEMKDRIEEELQKVREDVYGDLESCGESLMYEGDDDAINGYVGPMSTFWSNELIAAHTNTPLKTILRGVLLCMLLEKCGCTGRLLYELHAGLDVIWGECLERLTVL